MKRSFLLAVLLLPVLVFAQLTGRVVNDNNEGVPYANVAIKNSSSVATTDSAGRFSLETIQKFPFTLIVSSAGYTSQEFTVRNAGINNVIIQLQLLFQRDTVTITPGAAGKYRRMFLSQSP